MADAIIDLSDLKYGKVKYSVKGIYGDGPDADQTPDYVGVGGTWVLSPVIDRVLVSDPTNSFTAIPAPIRGVFTNGVLTYRGQPYVWLLASPRTVDDKPMFKWKFEATYLLTGDIQKSELLYFDFLPTAVDGEATDITEIRPIDAPALGTPTVRGPKGDGVTDVALDSENRLVFSVGLTELPPVELPSAALVEDPPNSGLFRMIGG